MTTLFKTPTTGNFFRPKQGQYIGEFRRHEEGPESRYTEQDGSPKKMIRWVWDLYDFNNPTQRILDNDGNPAEGDGLTSRATGPKSKAAGWFQAHGRPLQPGDDMEQAVQDIVGKRVMLLYTGNDGETRLSSVLPYNG